MANRELPSAFKIFVLALFAGAAGGYGAFRLAFYLAYRFISGEHRDALALAIAVLSCLLIGVASAVTAGVIAGRAKA